MQMEELAGDTLALLNVARQAFGAEALTELPDSHKGNSSACLYANALKDIGVQHVGGDGGMTFADDRIAATVAGVWGVEANGNHVKAPSQFEQVIGKFDNGELGHYSL